VDPALYDKAKSFASTKVYYRDPSKPVAWNNPVKSKDAKRKLITAILDIYSRIFGKAFYYPYQDLYLKVYGGGSGYDRVYFMARNYDLMGRKTLAERSYRTVIEGNAPSKEDASFFYGALLSAEGDERGSTGMLKGLLAEYPRSKWIIAAHYYLGRNSALNGDVDTAKEEYRKVIKLYQNIQSDAEAMRVLETDVVLRLDHLTGKK
jgi:TolA-binding protein